jgi:coenzyme PQQ precursor peptide PqqA
LRFEVIKACEYILDIGPGDRPLLEDIMKTWTKPAVREQEVGLEVTSYLPAEIDVI